MAVKISIVQKNPESNRKHIKHFICGSLIWQINRTIVYHVKENIANVWFINIQLKPLILKDVICKN